MHRRHVASLAAIATLALAVGIGCEEEKKAPPAPTASAKSSGAAATTGAPKASGATAGTGAAAATGGAAAPAAGGSGTIKGVVSFTGKAPEMKVPTKRKDAEFCKGKEVAYNAVVAKDGKLKDVLVRIENGGVKGNFEAPKTPAHVDQVDCMYTPRIQGVVAGQSVEIKNSDGTLHNVHTYKGAESWFNQAQPKGSAAIEKEAPEEAGIVKFTCDVHPWMRGFVVVTDHPFFAVSGDDGSFTISKVPAGKYNVEAWHATYGLKKGTAEVADGKEATVAFSFDGTEAEPDVNKDELKGLW
jgi:plastocyanin